MITRSTVRPAIEREATRRHKIRHYRTTSATALAGAALVAAVLLALNAAVGLALVAAVVSLLAAAVAFLGAPEENH